jgi:23S rRNA pseudouridine1911/1915/1917 synthase
MKSKPANYITAGQQHAQKRAQQRAELPKNSSSRPKNETRKKPGTVAPKKGRAAVSFIFEDQAIIAVDKPAGLATIPADGSRALSLLDLVSKHLQRRHPGGRAAVVHRLDRDTSGIMIFATNARAKTVLMKNWNDLVIRRQYKALVEGRPATDEGTLDSWLLESGPSLVRTVPAGTAGALRARTHYRLLSSDKQYSLLELELETGRRHQIRVQLAAIGCPVAGDERYGARSNPRGRLCLHACLLELKHPFEEKILILESPQENFGYTISVLPSTSVETP